MKKLFLLTVLLVLSASCSNDDGFEEANGQVAKKYLTKAITNGDNQTHMYEISYNSDGNVNTISNGTSIRSFIYDSGNLTNIAGEGDDLIMNEVYNTIYDGYEIGQVLQYDEKGNPIKLELYDYDWQNNQEIFIANITYDQKPFMFYYTLDAAGIIEVLNNTRLNFSFVPTAPEIIMAKLLLPVNNPVGATINNENGNEVGRVTVSYDYDSDNYPNSPLVTTVEDGYVNSYTVNYEYRN